MNCNIILSYKKRKFISVRICDNKIIQKGSRKGYKIIVLTDCKLQKNSNNASISLSELDEILKMDNKIKLISSNQKYYSATDIVNLSRNEDVITLIQIVSSSNNHATVHKQSVSDCTKKIICKKNGKLVLRSIKLHYCSKCNQYFDFSNSFYNQISNYKMARDDIYAILINDRNKEIHHESSTLQLKDESRLKTLGYSSTLPARYRQRMLKDFVKNNLLSISEMKSILEFLIRFVGSQSRMAHSKNIWEDDISYLNTLINNF